ncbi:hypothetical protein [Nocardioides stalactiti]|uniref:hypothetical protein n=1 Tax=Nocardioides stalactiti TaxID=2755356 RepID=UPI001601CDD1|nr:hypothetical protein [Nocardioides stalactiti]
MTSVTWALADALGISPAPPNPRLAATLAGWWSRPRLIGCQSLKRDPNAPWFVLAPDPAVVCGGCLAERYPEERRCLYCHGHVAPEDEVALVYEMKTVTVVARAHEQCHESDVD